jgi:hypothetical protein
MSKLAPRAPDQCFTPSVLNVTPYPNMFQGEPAISGFDWHITPYHNSSETLAAVTSAGLHFVLPKLHPDHGKLTRFRVIHHLLKRAIHARFHYGFDMALS